MRVLLLEKEKLLRELNCLYNISRIMEENTDSIDHILAEIVLLIPEAFSYPGCSFAGISYKGKEYVSTNFKNPDIVIERDLVIDGKKTGQVTIGYTGEDSICSEFLSWKRYRIY